MESIGSQPYCRSLTPSCLLMETIPPNGQSIEDFSNNFPAYIVDITNQLNSQAADSFQPSLTALDQLVGSIQIQP